MPPKRIDQLTLAYFTASLAFPGFFFNKKEEQTDGHKNRSDVIGRWQRELDKPRHMVKIGGKTVDGHKNNTEDNQADACGNRKQGAGRLLHNPAACNAEFYPAVPIRTVRERVDLLTAVVLSPQD